MRESSLVPTNLLSWPPVARRLPEEKLILAALWFAPWMSCAGYGELPLCPFAASLGISPESTETGITNLEKAGLVFVDGLTAELALDGWFRFHRFKTPTSRTMLKREIEKIRSEAIKKIVSEKSLICLPTTTPSASSESTTTTDAKVKQLAEPLQQEFDDRMALYFPSTISQSERKCLHSILVRNKIQQDQWQVILDELFGAMTHREINSPVAFTMALVQRAADGKFTPERGVAVAQRRMDEEVESK